MTKQEIRKHIVMLNSDLNDQAYLRTNGTITETEYKSIKARIQKRIRELREELSATTENIEVKQVNKDGHSRCSIHKMYHLPCKICKEIEQLKSDKEILLKLNNNQETYINELVKNRAELEKENSELSESLEQVSNLAYKSYNPEAKLKLSVNDLLVVRGIFVANSFLFNSLHNIDQCIEKKQDPTTKEQLSFIKKDLEKEWQRVVDLLKVFAKEFSDSNWNRMIRETQKIVELSVETMNSRELGHFTVGKNDELDIEYQVRPLVIKAVNDCIDSSGTNSLTAYSKEQLVKSITKIVEEK